MSMFVVVAMLGAIRAVADGEAPAGGRRIGTSCKPFSAMPVRDNATPPQVYPGSGGRPIRDARGDKCDYPQLHEDDMQVGAMQGIIPQQSQSLP